MSFTPYIQKRKEFYRMCKCGRKHENKYIYGVLNYAEDSETIFCVALLEHKNDRHIWLTFITGEWPETNHEDCAVTAHIHANDEGKVFTIKDGQDSPFLSKDIFECYQVTREQVISVSGAKEWFIGTYLSLFKTDNEINDFFYNYKA
jgi:hypothetical protein